MVKLMCLLQKRNFTLHSLAIRSGVSPSTVTNIVHYKHRAVQEQTAERISKALRVEMDEVFEME